MARKVRMLQIEIYCFIIYFISYINGKAYVFVVEYFELNIFSGIDKVIRMLMGSYHV